MPAYNASKQYKPLPVILPDCQSILNVGSALQNVHITAADLIWSLLSNTSNTESLQTVFGSNFDPSAFTSNSGLAASGSHSVGTWWIDALGMPWALQAVEVSPTDREWDQDELDEVGDGLLPLDTPIHSFLHAFVTPQGDGKKRSFHASLLAANVDKLSSSFDHELALTDYAFSGQLRTPRLRLVCGAPGLAVRLRFAHVPEIADGWQGRVWFLPASRRLDPLASGRGSHASELLECVREELGIRKIVMQGARSVRIEYALANVKSEEIALPPPPALSAKLSLPEHLVHLPGPPDAYPRLFFTISASWLNRLGNVAMGFSKYTREASLMTQRKKPVRNGAHALPYPRQIRQQQQKIDIAPISNEDQNGFFNLWGSMSFGKSSGAAMLSAQETQEEEETVSKILKRNDMLQTGDSELDSLSRSIKGDHIEENEEGEGTLKAKSSSSSRDQQNDKLQDAPSSPSDVQRSSIYSASASRLSRMFEGWLGSSVEESLSEPKVDSPSSPQRPTKRIISGPIQLKERPESMASLKSPTLPSSPPSQNGFMHAEYMNEQELKTRFENLMDDLDIPTHSRSAMLSLPVDRKIFLINQHESKNADTSSTKEEYDSRERSPSIASSRMSFTDSVVSSWAWNIISVAGWTTSESAPPRTLTSDAVLQATKAKTERKDHSIRTSTLSVSSISETDEEVEEEDELIQQESPVDETKQDVAPMDTFEAEVAQADEEQDDRIFEKAVFDTLNDLHQQNGSDAASSTIFDSSTVVSSADFSPRFARKSMAISEDEEVEICTTDVRPPSLIESDHLPEAGHEIMPLSLLRQEVQQEGSGNAEEATGKQPVIFDAPCSVADQEETKVIAVEDAKAMDMKTEKKEDETVKSTEEKDQEHHDAIVQEDPVIPLATTIPVSANVERREDVITEKSSVLAQYEDKELATDVKVEIVQEQEIKEQFIDSQQATIEKKEEEIVVPPPPPAPPAPVPLSPSKQQSTIPMVPPSPTTASASTTDASIYCYLSG